MEKVETKLRKYIWYIDDDSQMRALLLHCAGPDVQGIFMHLEEAGTICQAAMDALDNHFEPKKNVVFERHVFRQAIQGTDKPLINFVTRLHKLASTCDFANQIPKSEIISLICAHLIPYVVVYCKNPILN